MADPSEAWETAAREAKELQKTIMLALLLACGMAQAAQPDVVPLTTFMIVDEVPPCSSE